MDAAIPTIATQAINGLIQQSPAEIIAVCCGIAYLLLAMRESLWCWPCAFVSTALFTWVFYDALLPMEAVLNIYYMCMAIYGYWCWKFGGTSSTNDSKTEPPPLPICCWPIKRHCIIIGATLVLTAASGLLLNTLTDARHTYLDSFIAWGSIVTTYMVTQKVLENWLYWIILNSAALYLYIEISLYPTALLMLIYIALAVAGYTSWRRLLPKKTEEAFNCPP